MKKIRYCLLLFAFIVCCISCGKNTSGNTESYIPGQDMQYFSTSEWYKTAVIQEYDGGCYVHHDGFVYRYDRETGTIEALCSKPNCLHDRETDTNKRRDCNAYLDNITQHGEASLMLYRDHVYALYGSNDATQEIHYPGSVIRIACDGSNKDTLLKADDPELGMIHRGYLYYVSQNYRADEASGVAQETAFYRVNVESRNPKPEMIYKAQKEVNGLGFLRGYGNHIYFTVHYKDEEGYPSLYVYDLKTREVKELQESMSGRPTWYKEKIYMRPFEYGEDYRFETPLYRLSWDGSGKETVMEKLAQGYETYSDGKYLYLDNQGLYEFYGDKRQVMVYDENMKMVDEYTYPDTYQDMATPPIGGERYQYLKYIDEETGEWGLMIWDKSSIGTLHGSPYTQTKVPYIRQGEDGENGDKPSVIKTEEVREYITEADKWSEDTVSRTEVKSPDKIDGQTAEGHLSFDDKSVKADISYVGTGTKTIEVWGYYLMEGSIFRNGYTVTATGETSCEAELILPEGAEKYLGATARHFVEKDGMSWRDFTSAGRIKGK